MTDMLHESLRPRCAECGRPGYRRTVGPVNVVGHLARRIKHVFRESDWKLSVSPEQALADGLALERLREALPGHTVTISSWRSIEGRVIVVVSTEGPVAYRKRRVRWFGEGPTIAEAADACRAEIEGQG